MTEQLSPQVWQVQNFFSKERFQYIRDSYRRSRQAFTMQYDNRILTPWADSPELQAVVQEETERVSGIVGRKLAPQVGYISIDLSGTRLMMHRLHPDIYVQLNICMGDTLNYNMGYSYCTDTIINETSEIDYQPNRPIQPQDCVTTPYLPNLASVYLSEPRSFVGMLNLIPANTVREVLVLSYTRA